MLEFLGTLPGAAALGLIWGIMAIGVYITYRILDIPDLTVDGSFVTGAALCAICIVSGVPFILAILIGFAAGLICGLITGLFHVMFGIPAILAGILTQLILWSINLKILGGANLSVSARSYTVLMSQLNVPDALWKIALILAVVIGLLYLFFGTQLGASIRATGNNPNMSRAQGINVKLNKVLGLMLSNGLVAMAGALLAQYQGFADINMGRGAIVIGLAAVIIGEAIIRIIDKNFAIRLVGVAIGGIIYYLVYQTVIFLGLDPDLLKMLSAIVVAIFLGFPYLRKTGKETFARRRAKKRLLNERGSNDA